jgi:hypothetical protein
MVALLFWVIFCIAKDAGLRKGSKEFNGSDCKEIVAVYAVEHRCPVAFVILLFHKQIFK